MASCTEEDTVLLIADSGIDLSISVNKPVQLGGDGGGNHTMLHLAAMRGWARMAERLVARSIPVVEAFVEWGVRPSALALSRVERTVPLMR